MSRIAKTIGIGKPTSKFSPLMMSVFLIERTKAAEENSFSKFCQPTQGLSAMPRITLYFLKAITSPPIGA